MKKLVILSLLSLFIGDIDAFAGALIIDNQLSCSTISATIYTHDPTFSCTTLTSNTITLNPGTHVGLVDVTNVNTLADCGGTATGTIGWAGSRCASTSGSWGWDRVIVIIGGVGFMVVDTSGCAGGPASDSKSVPGCGTVTVTWSTDAFGNHTVAIN